MQNADEEVFELYSDKLYRFIETICPNLISFIDCFGVSTFFAIMHRYLENLELDDDLSRKRKARLSMRLAMLDHEQHKLLNIKNSTYELNDKIKFLFLSSADSSDIKEGE